MPIVEALEHFINKQPLSYHVPGHKNGLAMLDSFPSAMKRFLAYDLTELSGLDDLHSPEGCIMEAEALLADLYRTKKSYLLINGSTVGNLTMIMAACEEGDTVFVQRNCHKSILHALQIAKLAPVFLEPEYDTYLQAAGGVNLETVRMAYRQYPKAKALILTYPTYYGGAESIEDIIAEAKSHHSLVLVDEAHGPHFIAGGMMPASSLTMGADVVVHSAHKVLPAMTMGSYLHVNSDRVSVSRLEFYLQALQSSSPSYPIMASLDMARAYAASFTKEDQTKTLEARGRTISLFKAKGLEVVSPRDPMKLIIRKTGYSGFELQQELEAAGIFTELADPVQVLCTLPLLKAGEIEYMKAAEEKFADLSIPDKDHAENSHSMKVTHKKVSTLSLTYQEQSKCSKETISLKEAAGRIAAEMVIPYPPGIPLIMSGERLTEETIGALEKLMDAGTHFHGGRLLDEKKITVFSV
ncbi:arginine/lysine/ornithine decarboxylase [Bacillus ectoiniformans]|nr:arginine/lysine/ornithine decarboxylase [Bacillus ectoiniformans]